MGDGSDSARCLRWCKEFEREAIGKFASASSGMQEIFSKLYLGYENSNFEVHLYGVLRNPKSKTDETVVSFLDVLYWPGIEEETSIDNIVDLFSLSRKDAIARLKKAQLIDKNYAE